MHTRMRLGELLLASGLLSADQLEAALQGQRSSGMKLGEYLIKQGICRESDVVDAVCRQTGIERYTPSRFPLNLSLSDRLPADVAQRTNAVPLLIRGDVLVVAMMDPLDIDALDRIEIVTDREVEPVMCLRQEFTQLYAALYGHFNTMDGVMESFTALPDQPVASDDLLIASETPKDELGQPDEAPVVRLVNSILTQAVRESASDIHISPEKDSIQIRFRIDGKLRKTPSPPKSVGASIVSRIKILANMDISITRVPQDGRFTMMVDRREINVRVSTLPTIYGENVVMRLLDMSTNHVYTLDKLGMSDKDCKTISQTIERPYGMILSTGPTGSGKSTSLYSILQLLNKPDVNAITLEDPVEYRIDGIRQVQLNVRAGMTFASGLRSILRQDPDVIMVGEIRDSETAQIAVQAALTGPPPPPPLPQVEPSAPTHVIGRNTREAMRSGVVLGEVARIDGMLDMVLAEMRATKAAGEGDVPIVITGDDAEALAALVGHSLTVDGALTLRGLAELYRINQKPRRV